MKLRKNQGMKKILGKFSSIHFEEIELKFLE
jgi:hypothetical protein